MPVGPVQVVVSGPTGTSDPYIAAIEPVRPGLLAPQATGLYQFNVLVPDVPDNGAVPMTISLAGVPGAQTLYIAVQH